MPGRIRLLFSSLSLTLLLLAAIPLYREFSQRTDIWWTPQAMLVPLAESGDRVEIYARGKPLVPQLQAGRLQIAEEAGSSTLTPSDVGLRFNNLDRVRAERLPMLLVYAAGSGAAACMFLLILTGRLVYRSERNNSPP